MKGHRVNITLYTVFDDDAYVHQSFIRNFRPIAKDITRKTTNEHEIVTIHLKDDTMIMLYISSDENLVKHHRESLTKMFQKVSCDNQQLKTSVIEQFQYLNCICGCVFEKDDNLDRTQGILEILFDTAQDTHSYILLPPMDLYNETGQLILSKKGESDVTYLPVMTHEIYRTNRSLEIMSYHKVEADKIETPIDTNNLIFKSEEDVIYRIGALYAICVYAEVMRNSLKNNNMNQFVRQIKNEFEDFDRQSREDAWVYIHQMNAIFKGKVHEHFTTEEHEFLNILHPEMEVLNRYCQQFESCAVLLWALGYFDHLPYPDRVFDMSKIASIMWSVHDVDVIIKTSQMKTRKEILDEADLYERYYTVSKNMPRRRKNTLNHKIVKERRISFQWLIGNQNSKNWDEIRKANK